LNPSEIAELAFNSSADEIIDLAKKVKARLMDEREKGFAGKHEVLGGLVKLFGEGRAVIVGDLHGDMESLLHILKQSGFMGGDANLIFLGDYGDRGSLSPEVIYTVLKLKEMYGDRVIMLRGNHERPPIYPHDLPIYLEYRYGERGEEVYRCLLELFDSLHHAAILEGKYLMLHGGLPEDFSSIEDLANPREDALEQILWSDPKEIEGTQPSPRGAGKLFGEDVAGRVLTKIGVKTLIRSHEPCDGVSINHDGKVLTIFSRKGAPYLNRYAAYLEIDLSGEVLDAYRLAENAHKF